jgi:hypothetical protein
MNAGGGKQSEQCGAIQPSPSEPLALTFSADRYRVVVKLIKHFIRRRQSADWGLKYFGEN